MIKMSVGLHSRSAEAKRDYICGGAASLLNVLITFPMNKIMFRQQIDGLRLKVAIKQLLKEGMGTWYRGIVPPLLQRTLTVSLMFGTYTHATHLINAHSPYRHSPFFTHCLAASTAGCIEAMLMPFERAQCLLQAKEFNHKLKNTKHVFEVLRHHSLKESYRGLSAVLLRNTISNILFLGLREPLKNCLPAPKTQFQDSVNSFISGAGLGCILSTVFFPVNVIKNRMMTKIGGDFLSIYSTYRITMNERVYFRRLFRGVHINYTRSFISWGIINTSFDFLVKLYDRFMFND
ncbi:PREDICTED: solute carrier family 25 member 51-like [Amphimedon queenslandica]|uniref:Solute carrier family 25 member 51 n=1 Tax=Amphimedon queenslandica TaxID=400682 RepID=A0A1X7U2I3_AMPQE|nr:PREDICTED: solute carrier family 25 member 51-like [Amphimedon queenslandica]|eukprot:XP_003389171.2 PREDICTED: solute carrier family 25 member 51-like [Amphimedon queenslandica]